MKNFKEYQNYLKEESHLIEMTNIGPKQHKFGIDVKIHILQPAEKELSHGPRLKIFKKKDRSFIITLPKNIKNLKIKGDTSIVKKTELKTLINIAKHYKEAFVSFWCNDDMSGDELMDFIEAINLNKYDVIEEFRKEYPITCY